MNREEVRACVLQRNILFRCCKLLSIVLRPTDCEICGLETPAAERAAAQNPDAPAHVLYTSGTTGRPKDGGRYEGKTLSFVCRQQGENITFT